jgi:hypothetical protein
MFPKSIIEGLINNDVYIYIRNIDREFSGIVQEITSDNIVVFKDKYNNLINIPIDLIDVVTDRR